MQIRQSAEEGDVLTGGVPDLTVIVDPPLIVAPIAMQHTHLYIR